MRTITTVCLAACAAMLPLSGGAADEAEILGFLDSRFSQTQEIARSLWDFAEVGYKETASSGLLQERLAAEGFRIDAGVAGIPTAFVASYGSRGPVIGILAEFDALPGITQAAVPMRSMIEDKGAAHACGHNLFAAGSVGAAIAIRHWLEDNDVPGTVRVYGTPAEEGGSGKVYMVRAGLFDDADFVLHWHPADRNTAEAYTTLANRSARFRFHGLSAHAAEAPEAGRSALDGVEAFNYMVNLMREHVPQETRIHYVITSGGEAPNVVPDFAEVYYYVRHPNASILRDIWDRLEAAAVGAAQGTGTEVDWEIIHGNHPLLINETLAQMMDAKLRAVGGFAYSDQEQDFAEQIYSTLLNPDVALGSQETVQPFGLTLRSSSTDVGDVSIAVPTVGLRVATWVPGTAAHSWQAVAASGMSIGHKGADLAARTMSLAAVELFENAELRDAARAEHLEHVGEGFRYEALLGDRDPPLNYRD